MMHQLISFHFLYLPPLSLSTNKSFLNGKPIDPQRYYELREKDMLKFGPSASQSVEPCADCAASKAQL
jgi:hypothetical protein